MCWRRRTYTFADLTPSRSLPDWTVSHVRMFEFRGGAPELVVPDNEKAAVRRAIRYEPDLNPSYHELAVHYGTAVLPARPRSPRDKAKVEAAGPACGALGSGAAAQPQVLLGRRGSRGGCAAGCRRSTSARSGRPPAAA